MADWIPGPAWKGTLLFDQRVSEFASDSFIHILMTDCYSFFRYFLMISTKLFWIKM